MVKTPRLGLALIFDGQSSADVPHNENLLALDVMAGKIWVQDMTLTAPPGSPSESEAYVVAAGATGDWAGHDGELAFYFSGWRFRTIYPGFVIYDSNTDETYYVANGGAFRTISWTV